MNIFVEKFPQKEDNINVFRNKFKMRYKTFVIGNTLLHGTQIIYAIYVVAYL